MVRKIYFNSYMKTGLFLDPITYVLGVYWTASSFYEKGVPLGSPKKGSNISIQEKQAMSRALTLHLIKHRTLVRRLYRYKVNAHDILSTI